MQGIGEKIGIGIIFLFAFVLSISAIIRYFILDPVETNAILIREGMDMYEMKNLVWNSALFFHIISAVIPLIIGPFLFIKKLRNRHLNVHRNLGKVYVITILLSGLIGIYLSFYAHGGILAVLGFLFLDIAWIYITFTAYRHIRNKQQKLHEEWMYRSYAVTFAAITFRFWSAVVGYSLDNFTVGYVAAVWLAWVGNLIVIEMWIRLKLRKSTNMNRQNTKVVL